MDKIFSTRVDESVIHRIGSLARRLRTSKKRVIEDAVETYAARIEREQKSDVFEETSGAWRRKETARRTVEEARAAFRQAMERRRP
jgi:predicted transcriptional regulator